MSMFYLDPDTHPSALECPECDTSYEVGWWTEYGEPVFGEHDVECPNCGHEFTMLVDSGITIEAIPRRDNNGT